MGVNYMSEGFILEVGSQSKTIGMLAGWVFFYNKNIDYITIFLRLNLNFYFQDVNLGFLLCYSEFKNSKSHLHIDFKRKHC